MITAGIPAPEVFSPGRCAFLAGTMSPTTQRILPVVRVCACVLAALTAIGTGAANAADADGNYAVWGMGSKSCFAYKQAVAQGGNEAFREFVMGYLTAYNAVAQDTYRIEGSMSLDEIMAWLGDYCEARQMHSFEQALTDFTVEHKDARMKRSPSRVGR